MTIGGGGTSIHGLEQAALSQNQAACSITLFGRGGFAKNRHPRFRTPL
jgi:hypothetical protein